MKYRPEIDGLRAIAVISVILFHAGFHTFKGGFAGVDIFFVISGYLITSIILIDLKNDSFDIFDFYERRVRRIFPALIFVIALSIPIAWVWLSQNDMVRFSKSILSVMAFVSNYYFLSETGYFSTDAELKPLLHTWSLAVEEQFYLIFPISLIFLWPIGVCWFSAFLYIILFASFSLACAGDLYWPDTSFFILPTRIWELLVGALIAFHVTRNFTQKIPNFFIGNAFSAAGLAVIAYSVFFIGKGNHVPGPSALLPVLGTALIIIYASPRTLVHKLLSSKIFIGIGLISYSSYLWHQPLMAFARHRSLTEPSAWLMLSLCLATLAIGYVSWRYVERPFRSKTIVSRTKLIAIFCSFSLIIIIFGLSGIVKDGFPSRFLDIDSESLESQFMANHGLSNTCVGKKIDSKDCLFGSEPAELLLWGDSYAMHLAQALKASNTSVNFRQHTFSSCRPIIGISAHIKTEKWQRRCLDRNINVLDWIKQNPSVRFVVLGSPFTFYRSVIDAQMQEIPSSHEVLLSYFKQTVDNLREIGVSPIFVAPPPQTHFNIGNCIKKAILYGVSKTECNFEKSDILPIVAETYELLEKVNEFAPVLRLDSFICPQGGCITYVNGVPIYRDAGHLSKDGSAYLGTKFDIAGMIFRQIEAFDYLPVAEISE